MRQLINSVVRFHMFYKAMRIPGGFIFMLLQAVSEFQLPLHRKSEIVCKIFQYKVNILKKRPI